MQPVRAALSCTSCRQRKLKCDRVEPCGSCISRKVDCVYEFGPRSRSSFNRETQHQLESRIRRLEDLIHLAAASQKTPNDAVLPSEPEPNIVSPERFASQSNINQPPEGNDQPKPGRMMSYTNQPTYVADAHWAAIYSEIAIIRENVLQPDTMGETGSTDANLSTGPMLLDGARYCSSFATALERVPPRSVTDSLVSRYFNSEEPSIVFLHAPTFQKEYQEFWQKPTGISLTWLSMLFGMLSTGVFLFVRSQDVVPEGLGEPLAAMSTFQRCSADCLILSQYSSNPTTCTIEALLFNLHGEFVRHRDAHLGVWVLAGIIIRLSMRMGYHRDPKDFAQITKFQGEMRRRVWAVILQLDSLTSCQLGLPSMIQESQCDTQLPRNLHDEDFGPETTELPQSRPESELTVVIYAITKCRLLAIFRKIFDRVSMGVIEPYEEVMRFDSQLCQTHKSMSARLQMNDPDSFAIVSPSLLIRRYHLELLFQKARCVLHRNHMTKSYMEPQYAYSRAVCVESAMAILKHHADICNDVKAGGRLQRNRWFISSLERYDFLLASMVVCLGLSYRMRNESLQDTVSDTGSTFSPADLVEALDKSRVFWAELKGVSKEATQAFNVVTSMLDNTKSHRDEKQVDSDNVAPALAQSFGVPDPVMQAEALEAIEPWQLDASFENLEALISNPEVGNWVGYAVENFLRQ